MLLEPLLLTYAGLAGIAAGTHRIRNDLRWKLPKAQTLKLLGFTILAFAFWRAMALYGAVQGPVAWTGLLSLAAVALVLLASSRSKLAIGAAIPALLIALLCALIGW